MGNRYETNVFENISAGEYADKLSIYTDKDGNKAVILPGWTVSGISKENTIWGKDVSLVIYQIPFRENVNWEEPDEVEELKKKYSQLVWCPVAMLDPDGTLDGENFTEKFGRRNYLNDEFSDNQYNEPLEGELLEQYESVKKYGGFYISRYNISKSLNGKPQSVKGAMPWVYVVYNEAIQYAASFEDSTTVKTHLTYGAEYDSVEAWFIKSGAKTLYEVATDSTNWGNFWNTENPPREVVETGSREEWSANNIYDLAGNVNEWTQEKNNIKRRVIRGGYYNFLGKDLPVSARCYNYSYSSYKFTGYRLTYYIK